jgi:peroxiredoxin
MTPTCTVEACNLRDHFLALTIAGIEVIGISPDDEASHVKFIEKQQPHHQYKLPHHLNHHEPVP